MQAKTAIIIPTHNRPDLLKRAIRSALEQSRQPEEVIVVNDGEGNLNSYVPIIKVIKTNGNVGPTKARSIAMDALSPQVNTVCYLDDDDELLPNHLETLAPLVEEGNEFAFSKALYKYPDGTETTDPEPSNHGPKRYYDPNALLRQNIAPVSSFIHTRKSYDIIGGWDISLPRMEDWDFWGRLFIQFGPPTFANIVTNVIYKGLGTNRTDSNQFVYAMSCHWRDVVDSRLNFLASQGRGKLSQSDIHKFKIPKVGVLMPCYNASKFLTESMNSILGQTYQDIEVIAVNDGSTDATLETLLRYSVIDNRVRVFDSKTNAGVTKALNRCLMLSRSEYLARMDADDVAMPDRIEKQVLYLDEYKDIGIIGSRFWSMDESMKTIKWSNNVPTDPEEVKTTLANHCCIGHPTVMMRRRVIEEIGGYDESEQYDLVEDYEFWLRASKKFKIANLPQYLLKYREHDGQVTVNKTETQRRNFEAVRKKYSRR